MGRGQGREGRDPGVSGQLQTPRSGACHGMRRWAVPCSGLPPDVCPPSPGLCLHGGLSSSVWAGSSGTLLTAPQPSESAGSRPCRSTSAAPPTAPTRVLASGCARTFLHHLGNSSLSTGPSPNVTLSSKSFSLKPRRAVFPPVVPHPSRCVVTVSSAFAPALSLSLSLACGQPSISDD